MRAAQISEYGGPEVLQLTDAAPTPDIEAGQVLVEVRAASVNPFDVMVRSGAADSFAPLTFPATLGGDFAGVVSAVGDRVSGLNVGDEVYGQANAVSGKGSFAEFTPVKSESLSQKPTSVDFVTAAAYPLVSLSAYQALVDHMDLQAGQKVLIHGGAGGIGMMAVQLAKHFGAYVIATASADNIDFVKGLGADEVIDYQSQNFAELVHEVDAVFDTVGGETNQQSYVVIKDGGAFVSMVADAHDEHVSAKNLRYTHQFTRATTERLTEIAKLIDAGKLTINVDKTFPLDQAGEALDYLKTGHPRGKVVITVA